MMRPTRHLLTIVAVAFTVLFGTTATLGSIYHRIRDERAQSHLQHGNELAAQQELAAAVEQYRAALALRRNDAGAGRALALTLLSLGRLGEAEGYLRDLLARNPTDGALNRGLARIHAARGRQAEARAAYQRAIYGDWADDALEKRTETRFELIEYLKDLDARAEVIAELLRLNVELPADQIASARRVADMLVQQGEVGLGINVLSGAAAVSPRDAELLAHLADLQSRAGQIADARTTLRRAVSISPRRQDLQDQLDVVERVYALDPTLPRLRLVTMARRARLILAAVVTHTASCAAGAGVELTQAREDALRRLRQDSRRTADAAEEDLHLAERLWTGSPACHRDSVEARALAQVLARVRTRTESPS